MKRWLQSDSLLVRFLTAVFNLMWLNLLTILCSLPIVTAGASFTAMHYILLRMVRKEDIYITKTFFRVWRENLKQGIELWMIALFSWGFCFMGYMSLRSSKAASAGSLRFLIIVIAIVIFSIVQYEFPLLARYDNTVGRTISNAARLAIGYLGRTIVMTAVSLGFLALWIGFFLYLLPAIVIFGFTLPGYIDALLYKKIFAKLDEQAAS